MFAPNIALVYLELPTLQVNVESKGWNGTKLTSFGLETTEGIVILYKQLFKNRLAAFTRALDGTYHKTICLKYFDNVPYANEWQCALTIIIYSAASHG